VHSASTTGTISTEPGSTTDITRRSSALASMITRLLPVSTKFCVLKMPKRASGCIFTKAITATFLHKVGAVKQPGGLEIQLAARRTADEDAGKAPHLVHRFHEKVFRGRQPVDQREASVVGADGKRRADARQCGDLGHALFLRLGGRPARMSSLASGTVDVTCLQQIGREGLHHHGVPGAIGAAIERAVAVAAHPPAVVVAITCAPTQSERSCKPPPEIHMRRHESQHQPRRLPGKQKRIRRQPAERGIAAEHPAGPFLNGMDRRRFLLLRRKDRLCRRQHCRTPPETEHTLLHPSD
jgi:hypothetical protein